MKPAQKHLLQTPRPPTAGEGAGDPGRRSHGRGGDRRSRAPNSETTPDRGGDRRPRETTHGRGEGTGDPGLQTLRPPLTGEGTGDPGPFRLTSG